jgi:hypothetical protein
MCQEAKTLRSYAIARHKAYVIMDRLDDKRVKAITKILKVTDHFREAKATGWIHQIKSEVLAILPSEEGRFSKQRAEILDLLKRV